MSQACGGCLSFIVAVWTLVWMVTDVTSQRKAVEVVKTMKDEDDGDDMVVTTTTW